MSLFQCEHATYLTLDTEQQQQQQQHEAKVPAPPQPSRRHERTLEKYQESDTLPTQNKVQYLPGEKIGLVIESVKSVWTMSQPERKKK